jgi:diadenosine tetraphosphatase ApaH/serine/threonine PP2A family protein phosphatase
VALSFTRPEGDVTTGSARRGGESASIAGGEWLINPGSVGQPRDGDPRAAWLLLDTEAGWARFMRSEYAIERAQSDIRAAGLPYRLADRLSKGL